MLTRRTLVMAGEAVAALLLTGCLFLNSALSAKEKKKSAPESYAVIGGTVFREGFSLPGAEVALLPKDAGPKTKPMKSLSDTHGEFAFRVPVVPVTYRLSVKRSGFQPQVKEVVVEGEQRYEVNFNLEPEGK